MIDPTPVYGYTVLFKQRSPPALTIGAYYQIRIQLSSIWKNNSSGLDIHILNGRRELNLDTPLLCYLPEDLLEPKSAARPHSAFISPTSPSFKLNINLRSTIHLLRCTHWNCTKLFPILESSKIHRLLFRAELFKYLVFQPILRQDLRR
jgi:hypothetical protein